MTSDVLDSSCWIEYFNGSPVGERLAATLEGSDRLLVPSIVLLEVYRHALRHRGPDDATRVLSGMALAAVVDLDPNIAKLAAELGVRHQLPLADSVIYATARAHDATLWTLDTHFAGLPRVRLLTRDAG
ncbi:MAG: type II toxin-antitoxin system VapC family toxin [Gemmatimonadetes bacterium]|nr:type II toxin-antitoxin system VapC family toxin [Gemmatimonadota bacterium]